MTARQQQAIARARQLCWDVTLKPRSRMNTVGVALQAEYEFRNQQAVMLSRLLKDVREAR